MGVRKESGSLLWMIAWFGARQGHTQVRRQALSDEEWARFNGVEDKAARHQRILARAALRSVLGRCLGLEAGVVPIDEDRLGRPVLRVEGPAFSVSHAGQMTMIAVDSRARQIGVDIETVGRAGPLPRRALSAFELAALGTARGAALEERFMRYWTAKEAYLKGLGLGIRIDPREIEIDLTSSAPKLLSSEGRRWRLSYLDPCPGLVGTVATLRKEPGS
jgi:4'-phosphopantetheinyl transferase